ncbi:hypothetical protein QAD02_007746 [Eretmocerus hayati]|uniref:Uncharacterized protein n=1 Tax=Eretmocerus hayati TaxID=131215 RepID=A0ACC2N4F4_9HYME|nr:hypothetical protein QAD02_007746 [Eretmocerus hayati]
MERNNQENEAAPPRFGCLWHALRNRDQARRIPKLQLQRPVESIESTPGQSRVLDGPKRYKKRNIMDELMKKSTSKYLERKRPPPKEMPQTCKKPQLISSDSDSDESMPTAKPSTEL